MLDGRGWVGHLAHRQILVANTGVVCYLLFLLSYESVVGVVGPWASGPGRTRLALGGNSPVPSFYWRGQKRLVYVRDGSWRGTRGV